MKTVIALIFAALLGACSTYFLYGERPALSPAGPEVEARDLAAPEDHARRLIEARLLAPLREPRPLRRQHLIFASRRLPYLPLLDRPIDAELTAIASTGDRATATFVAQTSDCRWRWQREARIDLASEAVMVVEGAELVAAEEWLRRLRLSDRPPLVQASGYVESLLAAEER